MATERKLHLDILTKHNFLHQKLKITTKTRDTQVRTKQCDMS